MNSRLRRGENQNILLPLFKDEKTDMVNALDMEHEKYPGFIHLDTYSHGMLNACL
jgi:hypothetical protein